MPGQIEVLLVEDNGGDFALVQRALAKAEGRFTVTRASCMSEALAQLKARDFDVALVDLALPDSLGLDTVLRLRRHSPKLPIVLLTGDDRDETATEALDHGAQDYLVKDRLLDKAPTETLVRTIRYAIHRQKSSETQCLLEQLEASHTLLKSKNRRLAKLCKTAERFVENVSHEFRTPLTVIKEYASLLHGELLGPVNVEQAQYLNVIENRTDDLGRMVDDILDGSRLDAGILVMSRKRCHVADFVDPIRSTLERKAESRGKKLDVAIDPNLPEVYCDPEKISRVIVNLVINAIKFCGDPGYVKLRISADEPAKNVVVRVVDNGRGIDPEHLESIFARFKQVGNHSRQNVGGFGLGLSIAKELVELSFGQLTVASEVQKGSVFSFTLPFADPQEVVLRSLDRLAERNEGQFSVSLLSAAALILGDVKAGEDVHFLLNDALRASDLLFRVDSDHWLIVLATNGTGVDTFCARMNKMLEAVNRNRPRGPLPTIKLVNHGSWRLPGAAELALHEFARLAQPAEAVPA